MKEAEPKPERMWIEKAQMLGVPISDLLTVDGGEIAWKADKDFRVQINGTLVEFRKDEPLRDPHLIAETRKGRCPVSSLEPEVWRRVTTVQPAKVPADIVTLKPTFMGMSIDLNELWRRVWPRAKNRLSKSR